MPGESVFGEEYFGESEGGVEHWLPQKVVQCGKAIGVTMEESKGGWASLMELIQ